MWGHRYWSPSPSGTPERRGPKVHPPRPSGLDSLRTGQESGKSSSDTTFSLHVSRASPFRNDVHIYRLLIHLLQEFRWGLSFLPSKENRRPVSRTMGDLWITYSRSKKKEGWLYTPLLDSLPLVLPSSRPRSLRHLLLFFLFLLLC